MKLIDSEGARAIVRGSINGALGVARKWLGSPGGIAPLDEYGRVPAEHLPAGVQGEMFVYFGRVESTIKVKNQSSTASSEDAGYEVAYSASSHRFLLIQSGGIHSDLGVEGWANWAYSDRERYGTASADGVVPYTGKVYVCKADNSTYVWDGTQLAALDFGAAALAGKVDKEEGKGLSSNDYTGEEKQKLHSLPTGRQLLDEFAKYVLAVPGKGLSTADFTNELNDYLNRIMGYYPDSGSLSGSVAVFDGVLTLNPGESITLLTSGDPPSDAKVLFMPDSRSSYSIPQKGAFAYVWEDAYGRCYTTQGGIGYGWMSVRGISPVEGKLYYNRESGELGYFRAGAEALNTR